ncbi:YjgF-like protein [Cadophora sp. DSE1049]|nr:YjgF-like protein [Cadophora sp. DSE1049]
MSHLEYTTYEGYGERSKENFWCSQAVRVGNVIECSGQGGWDRQTDKIERETNAQIEQAFENVEYTLKSAGARGWEDVYFVRSYHLPLNDEALEAMIRGFRKYLPNHQPCWTAIGVARLGFDDMRVEIEVKAHVPHEKK